MRAFVVRPFGEKSGINFEAVHDTLIAPALKALNLEGGTTATVVEAGNIREDMFQFLLVADVVVADISVENPNVYYELGIRHALREKRTFLIRAIAMTSDVPFDLRTDRYLAYDPADPGSKLEALVAGLRATLNSDRQDSPVFRTLPELRQQDRSRFLPVPREFRDEIEYAARSKMRGKLALLGQEALGSLWESEGLRLVGREQFKAKAFEAGALTLEAVRRLNPDDKEANLLLGTIYQRLGDIPRSEEALQRVIDSRAAAPLERAEAGALMGRNLKSRWRESWKELASTERLIAAFDSPLLLQSYEAYSTGFHQDLNHYYSGLNALAMVTIVLELVTAQPDAWVDRFPSQDDAARRKRQFEEERQALTGAVRLSIAAADATGRATGKPDPWVAASFADFLFLTAEKAGIVVRAYKDALQAQSDFNSDSLRDQLRIYRELNLLTDKVTRVLTVLDQPGPAPVTPKPPRTILFTGHQVDAPDRKEPRFPVEKEPLARAAIRQAVMREAADSGAVGLAGAASGGDIIFHEVCYELGIPTVLYLALPPEDYIRESVAPARGDNWINRFWAIKERFPAAPVLASTDKLPGWLTHRTNYGIWQRNNLWMLNEALAVGPRNVTVLALWNGKKGDGPGGTADMIEIARARGAQTCVLDTNLIFAE